MKVKPIVSWLKKHFLDALATVIMPLLIFLWRSSFFWLGGLFNFSVLGYCCFVALLFALLIVWRFPRGFFRPIRQCFAGFLFRLLIVLFCLGFAFRAHCPPSVRALVRLSVDYSTGIADDPGFVVATYRDPDSSNFSSYVVFYDAGNRALIRFRISRTLEYGFRGAIRRSSFWGLIEEKPMLDPFPSIEDPAFGTVANSREYRLGASSYDFHRFYFGFENVPVLSALVKKEDPVDALGAYGIVSTIED